MGDLKIFLFSIKANNIRLVLVILITFFLLTIPSRLIYSIPIQKDSSNSPLAREIKVDIPDAEIYPLKTTNISAPAFSARSVIAVDIPSKAVIYMKNPNLRLLPASTTKMMTALIAYQYYDLEKVASISSPLYEGQIMKLFPEEQIKIETLLYGVLVHSANDAAQELAKMYPGGETEFIKAMNRKVINMGLKDTHFTNATGLENGDHYSTVHDLAIIGSEVMKQNQLAQMVGTKSITVSDVSGQNYHYLENINSLLGKVEGLKGIKTGWTESAGECLIAYVDRDDHQIITAILGSYDRFGETSALVEWIFDNHQWVKIGE